LPWVIIAVWFHCRYQRREPKDVLAVVTFTVVLAAIGITGGGYRRSYLRPYGRADRLAAGFFGGVLALQIHSRPGIANPGPQTFAALLLALPLLFGAEHFAPPPVPRYQVRTSIEIAAPPEVVWKRVVAFPPMPPATGWPFRLGFAYPIEARLTGEGLTADRQCRFSTRAFKEPILVWEPGKHFVFSVAEEPLLMKEMTPYRNVHVRHLEDHDFRPERVDFVITRLPNGNSRLDGTTIYSNKMWPGACWRIWTDAIIHNIHHLMFEHIKTLSESDVRSELTGD
jgi:hypothetical protein